jgi:hypothetical protein
MQNEPMKYWDNIPRETNRYYGDEADESDISTERTSQEQVEETKNAREFSE